MKHASKLTLFLILTVLIFSTVSFGFEWQGQVDSEGTKMLGVDPIIADIENDGEMEFFTSTSRSIVIFDNDGDLLHSLPIIAEQMGGRGIPVDDAISTVTDEWEIFHIEDSPAVGDINGDGFQDVVVGAVLWRYYRNRTLGQGGVNQEQCPYTGPEEDDFHRWSGQACHHPHFKLYYWIYDSNNEEYNRFNSDEILGNFGTPTLCDADYDGKEEIFGYATLGEWSQNHIWYNFGSSD